MTGARRGAPAALTSVAVLVLVAVLATAAYAAGERGEASPSVDRSSGSEPAFNGERRRPVVEVPPVDGSLPFTGPGTGTRSSRIGHLAAQSQTPDATRTPGGTEAARTDGVVDGVPDPCPAGWQADRDDPSLCEIVLDACPFSPFDDGDPKTHLMQLDSEYPEYCREATVPAGSERYQQCLDLIRETYLVLDDNGGCRVMQFRSCTAGSRIGPNRCRASERRTWRCEHGIPRNEFNTCYVAPDTAPDSTPVCAAGAPVFVTMDCQTYVGSDFLANPEDQKCEDYDTGNSPKMDEATHNDHWCLYTQSGREALCLKRSSATGGCSATATAIVCSEMRAEYDTAQIEMSPNPTQAQRERLAAATENALSAGCEPCLALPFSPVPDHCADEYLEDPVYSVGSETDIGTPQLTIAGPSNAFSPQPQTLRRHYEGLHGCRVQEPGPDLRDPRLRETRSGRRHTSPGRRL